MKARTLSSFVLVAVITLPMYAMATDLISFRFTGHVIEIDDDDCSAPLLEPGVISIDDPVSGIFTYDLDATDVEIADPVWGWYEDHSPPSPHSVTINSVIFQNDPSYPEFAVEVGNDWFIEAQDMVDYFSLGGYSDLSFVPSDLGLDDPEITLSRTQRAITLIDHTHTALPDDSLPSSLDSDDWDNLPYWTYITIGGYHSSDPSCTESSHGFLIDIFYYIDTLSLCLDNETGLCSNGIDDDCDGLIDLDDPECGACTEQAECEDSDECTDDDCVDHQCQHSTVNCDDANECTVDSCDTLSGCVNSCNATGPGDLCCDNPACQGYPVCATGTCVGSAAASTYGVSPVYGSSDLEKHLACLLLPVAVVIGLRIWRRKK